MGDGEAIAESIETLREEDLDECAHLLMVTFNADPWNDEYTLDTAKEQLAWHLRVPGCVGLVSISDGIVGFAIGFREPTDVGDVFNLSIFSVSPDAQRTGVGTKLLLNLEERLAKSGVKTIYLGTRKGTIAEAFYEKLGYKTNEEDIEMRHDLGN
jgi:aminoglycoside 6'-N-acetyltransferase I